MFKKLMTVLITTALSGTFLFAQPNVKKEQLLEYFNLDLSKQENVKKLDDFFNKNFGLSKEIQNDVITYTTAVYADGLTIVIKKEMRGSKEDLDKAYADFLHPFGSRKDAKMIVGKLGRYLVDDGAVKYCNFIQNTKFFKYGGKAVFILNDRFNNQTYKATVGSIEDCNKYKKETNKLKIELINMIQKAKQRN